MYGLEKKPLKTFEFDLEKDMKNDPVKGKSMLKQVDERMHEIKGLLRQGAGTTDFDKFGVLLHGYAALQKVLTKLSHKK